jgi:E3 ubiquitin-protein ligase EL5
VASSVVIFVIISIGFLSLQYCFDAWDRRESHGARPRRRRGDGTAGSNNGATRTRGRGVDLELLRSLPVTVHRAAAPWSKEDAVECSVCLAELQEGEEARFLPRCGHGYHAECVDMWLASHTTCPLCRLTVSKLDPESSQTPTPASALGPLPPEPANPPRSVRLGVSDHGAVTAANMTSEDDDDGDDTTAAPALVIEIPELAPVPTPTTPRDAAKSSPVSARPRSFRRLWSFGRQGTSSSSSCTCGGAGQVADVEQGTIVGMAVAEAQLSSEVAAGAAQGSACRVATGLDVRLAD